jgi:hypothetical protein
MELARAELELRLQSGPSPKTSGGYRNSNTDAALWVAAQEAY